MANEPTAPALDLAGLRAAAERVLALAEKATPGPWMVDATKALGAYGVWTDYATHPGHDGTGYGTEICSMRPADLERRARDADAPLIAEYRTLAPQLAKAVSSLLALQGRVAGLEAACRAAYDHAVNDPMARLDQRQLSLLRLALGEPR